MFQSADGASVPLSIQNEREWHRFCAEIQDHADLAADARFAALHRWPAGSRNFPALITMTGW
ncbi:hypothetical protein [Allgaiera indica]|uniref:hypothetical protein n=1 Tax=Allgaiera indica TaxID=765699 RepID=UPI00244E6CF8|nr:hypothetical protein [Allgaiera indica]